MKTTILVEKEIEITTLLVSAGVRYWESATVNGFFDEDGDLIPCRIGDRWCPEIDIDTGIIRNWTQGVKAEIYYKVCDDGSYYLKDKNGLSFAMSIENDYVPRIMCPKENGHGDYIIMDIDENGQIQNWNPYIEDFKDR